MKFKIPMNDDYYDVVDSLKTDATACYVCGHDTKDTAFLEFAVSNNGDELVEPNADNLDDQTFVEAHVACLPTEIAQEIIRINEKSAPGG